MADHNSTHTPDSVHNSLSPDEQRYVDAMRVSSDEYAPFQKYEIDRLIAIIDRLTAPQPAAPQPRTDEPEPPDDVYDIYANGKHLTARNTEAGAIEAVRQLQITTPNTVYVVEHSGSVIYDTMPTPPAMPQLDPVKLTAKERAALEAASMYNVVYSATSNINNNIHWRTFDCLLALGLLEFTPGYYRNRRAAHITDAGRAVLESK